MDPSPSVPYPRYSGPHYYKTETWVGNVKDGIKPQAAFEALRRWATPFSLGEKAVSAGDKTDIPGLGHAQHYVDEDHMTVVNSTVPGKHVLEPGNVHRSIVRRGDDIYVKTDGYGLGIFPEANRLASLIVWPLVDQNIRHFLHAPPPGAFDPFSGSPAPLPTKADDAPLPPSPPPPLLPAPVSDVPHWLAPYVPPIDWASPPPRGANSNDLGRSVPGSSAGDWLGLQQSDFGAFKKLPQGDMGKRSDLAPDSRDRLNTSVTNPLISMGLLRSSLDGN
jgi:hypothetical protein